ncbi:MAG: hypothetical protein LBQ20_08770 [Rhodanobacter sp.]|jgi:hypothetical protein|nr:hypothetical protein [Rhodanobacter sp.]
MHEAISQIQCKRRWRCVLGGEDPAALGCPVFACTPDQFPDLMAHALKRADLQEWAAKSRIATVRAA